MTTKTPELYKKLGIKLPVVPVGKEATRKPWRDKIKVQRGWVDMAEHAVKVAQRRLTEARVERDNMKIALSAAY
jgi:hypothetical protein